MLDSYGFFKQNQVQFDRLAREVDTWLSQLTPLAGDTEPAKDSFLTKAVHDQQFTDVGMIRRGLIKYAVPYFDYYLVAMETGELLPCTRLLDAGSAHIFGVHDTSMLPADTQVSVLKPNNSLWGYITGVLPPLVKDGRYTFSDWIFQGSGVGMRRQSYYRDLLRRFRDRYPVQDFSDNRPNDQLPFDWGAMNALGGGIHIDPLHFFLRIDESCGVFGFYPDQTLRVIGQNLDIWSLQHMEQRRNDEGELTYYNGECVYTWEAYGGLDPTTIVHRTETAKDVLFNKPFGALEPKEDDQKPFYRYEEYGGYLGQGRIRQMALPPQNLQDTNAPHTYSDGLKPVGVFREHIALDGSYSLASAKQVSLAKRTLIPIPQRKVPQESYDLECDASKNGTYKFAGTYGGEDLPEHYIGDLSAAPEHKHLLSAAAVLDLHSYTYNWKSLHAFHYHEGDYDLPDEKEVGGKVQAIPPFSELQTKTWLSAPPWGQEVPTKHVDHRYGDVRYLEVLSHITLDEYGSVVIQGGAGEEIRMVGGNIQISCPGNILFQSGKSTVTMAGRDAVVRAKKSVDITASDNDVRLKAERNMQLLSGNSGRGGTLIENRAQGTTQDYPAEGGEEIEASGVVIKAAASSVNTMSQSVYIRTGSAEGGVGAGDIVLDADQGRKDIRATAAGFFRYLASQAVDTFGLPTAYSVNTSGVGFVRVGGALDVAGEVRGTAGATFMTNVYAVTGHFYSSRGGDVDRILDVGNLRNNLATKVQTPAAGDLTRGQKEYKQQFTDGLYADGKIGEPETQATISFSLRNEAEYGTSDFVLPQVHWQTLAEGAAGTTVWAEPVVVYQGVDYMPWPGNENWTSETFLRLPPENHTLYDIVNGYSRDRGEIYEDCSLGEFEPSIPQNTYSVIKH